MRELRGTSRIDRAVGSPQDVTAACEVVTKGDTDEATEDDRPGFDPVAGTRRLRRRPGRWPPRHLLLELLGLGLADDGRARRNGYSRDRAEPVRSSQRRTVRHGLLR